MTPFSGQHDVGLRPRRPVVTYPFRGHRPCVGIGLQPVTMGSAQKCAAVACSRQVCKPWAAKSAGLSHRNAQSWNQWAKMPTMCAELCGMWPISSIPGFPRRRRITSNTCRSDVIKLTNGVGAWADEKILQRALVADRAKNMPVTVPAHGTTCCNPQRFEPGLGDQASASWRTHGSPCGIFLHRGQVCKQVFQLCPFPLGSVHGIERISLELR